MAWPMAGPSGDCIASAWQLHPMIDQPQTQGFMQPVPVHITQAVHSPAAPEQTLLCCVHVPLEHQPHY